MMKHNDITISIITATYNAEKTIESTIQSIIGQTYKNIEYIIIDGGSADNTVNIINKYRPYIHHFVSEKDHGIYDAINKGIALASGDVIGILHADDIFFNNQTIENVAFAFLLENCSAIYGDLYYVNAQDTNKVLRNWKSKHFEPKLLKMGWMPPHPTLFIKKKVFDEIGIYSLNYKIAADYDFILRLFSNPIYTFKYLPQVITKMRIGGESNKSIHNIILKSKEDLKALKQNNVGGVSTLVWKNLSKIPQFIKK